MLKGKNTTGKERVTLIADKSGDNAKATFKSGNTVELRRYAYSAQKDGNTNNWVLAATGKTRTNTKSNTDTSH